jgi:hypothetical protein
MPTRARPDIPNTRRWFYLDPERLDLYAAAAAYAGQLAEQYGNVYTGIRTYRTKQRTEQNANPGRVIFVDDAPAAPALPYSASIRTSAASRHGYYKCDAPVSKDDARRAAAALGGDPSGVDLTQLIRLPGTVNTKHGERWPVELERAGGPIYSLDQVRAAFPAVAAPAGRGVISPLNLPQIEKHLANMPALLASPRARCIKPETQSGRILAGEMLVFPIKGRDDDSRSINGYVLGNGFYLRGFTDDEIAAVMFYHYRKWGVERDKGTAWCKNDISRAIARMHAEKPGVVQSPTRYVAQQDAAPLIEQPAASRARSDRPRKFDALMLFNRYQAQPELCELPRKGRAAQLDISTATLDRLEDALEAWGLIEIQTAGKGRPGRVILAEGVINIGALEVLSAPEPPIAEPGISAEQNDDRNPQCIGETHPPPETPKPTAAAPAPPLRRLVDAVREAFNQVRVDQATGERRKVTRRRVLAALAELGSWPAEAIERAIAEERQRRRIAAIVDDIRGMPVGTLRAQLRLMERLGDKSRELGTNLYRYADWAAREMRAELASRPAKRGRKPRRNCEALPDLRAAGATYQAELLDLVDQVRSTTPRLAPIAIAVRVGPPGGRAAGVFPQTPVAAASHYDVGGLVGRLRQLQAQRQASAA